MRTHSILRFLQTALLVGLPLLAAAVPAKRGLWRTKTLADGTQVKVQLIGDERFHYFADAEGQRYLPLDNQRLKRVSASELTTTGVRRMAARSAVRRSPRRIGDVDKSVFQGTQRGLIILVQYTDTTFKPAHNQALYDDIANAKDYHEGKFMGSVQDYFYAQSYGKFTLQFDVVGPVTLGHSQAYYGGNDANGNDLRPGTMVAEACMAIDDQVDFSQYDWNGDGKVDQIYVIYAGMGEADGVNAESTVWPQSWQLSESDYGKTLSLDGVTIDQFACSNEVDGFGDLEGIGTICHEFSHCMGFPDMYDILYQGNFGMGDWDLMDSGNYNGGSFLPAGYSAYERMLCGWNDPVELLGDTMVTDIQPSISGGQTFIIYNKGHRDEYYLIENRQRQGWDAGLPGSGMLVTHVDYDSTLWALNIVNATGDFTQYGLKGIKNDHQRLTLVHADDDDDSQYFNPNTLLKWKTTEDTDPYPYLANDSLTNYSTPAAITYNRNLNNRRMLNVAINSIYVDDNGVGSFSFVDFSNQADTTQHKPGTLFYESFDGCEGSGGNDGLFSGGQAGTAAFVADNDGWDGDAISGADQCVKTGTSKKSGDVTTPDIQINGTATLTFLAAPFGKDDTTLTLRPSGGFTITPSSFELAKDKWTECTATISGEGLLALTFSPVKRMFLDEVLLMDATYNGIGEMKPAMHIDNAVYNLQGVRMNADSQPRGIYIKNGKKIVIR